MSEEKKKYPDIYLLSKLPGLEDELQKCIPKECNLIVVKAAAPLINWNEGILLSQEEKDFLKKAEVLVCDSTYFKNLIYSLPAAKLVQTTWAGVDMLMTHFDKSKPLPNYITTRYSDSYFSELMSNYVIAQIINMERRFYTYRDDQKQCKWYRPYFPNFRVLSNLKIGILGGGTLGSAVGRLLKKSGCHVTIFTRTEHNSLSEDYDMCTTDLNVILEACDYICNVLPSTPQTKGLLDGDVLQKCCKKPVFMNIGRSDIIQPSTIIRALKEKWISKAVLDVLETEPLPPESPLWAIEEVYITPHVGGIPKIDGLAKFIVENYTRFINDEPVLNVVDWLKGY